MTTLFEPRPASVFVDVTILFADPSSTQISFKWNEVKHLLRKR